MNMSQPVTVLILGATGKTGFPLVKQLLHQGNVQIRAIVRSKQKFSDDMVNNPNLTLIEGSILDFNREQLSQHVKGCDAVAQCLGHVGNWEGIFGEPKFLCRDAVSNICSAIEANKPPKKVRFVVMNSEMVISPDKTDKPTLDRRVITSVLRRCVPAHLDNEATAQYLFEEVGTKNRFVEWTCVRPGGLRDDDESDFEVTPNVNTSIPFSKRTTRSNCARFMANMVVDESLFDKWKFKFPNVCNAGK